MTTNNYVVSNAPNPGQLYWDSYTGVSSGLNTPKVPIENTQLL